MKKLLYSILAAGLTLVGCTTFDDPVTESYGAGPSVSIEVSAVADNSFTFTVTPASGTQFYSFVVAKGDAAQQLNASTLLKGGYSGIVGDVVEAASQATFTFDMTSNGEGICSPNTTYQIYAVAANDKGIVGEVANASATTTDGVIPSPVDLKQDGASKAVAVNFSEAVARGNGAVTAKYYKEWDILNPVTVAEEEIVVETDGSTVVFAAPTTPDGAIVTFSWTEGAFVDSYGNKCAAFQSGLNMNTGKFTGVYVSNDKVTFEVTDENVSNPELGESFGDWTGFMGTLAFDFDLYRNDNTVASGDLKVVYKNENKTSTINLSADEWMVQDGKLYFILPEEPAFGDYVGLEIAEGAFTDVYGNSNAEYTLEDGWLRSYGYKRDMVIGTYTLTWTSYFDGTEATEDISIEADPDSEDGLIITGFMTAFGIPQSASMPVEAVFNGDYATVSIPQEQVVFSDTDNIFILVNADSDGDIVANVSANGNLTINHMWGYYALSAADGSELGYQDAVLPGATFTKSAAQGAPKKSKTFSPSFRNSPRKLK